MASYDPFAFDVPEDELVRRGKDAGTQAAVAAAVREAEEEDRVRQGVDPQTLDYLDQLTTGRVTRAQ